MIRCGVMLIAACSNMDIEGIIDHIQKQGCNVRVEKGYLVLWKAAKGSICQIAWGISHTALNTLAYEQMLFDTADRTIAKLNKKIVETDPPAPPRRLDE